MLENKLEAARVRAEKADSATTISQKLEREYALLERDYGEKFAPVKREYDGLASTEGYYDSFAEQMQRRDDYIKSCEAEIKRLKEFYDVTGKNWLQAIQLNSQQNEKLQEKIEQLEQENPLEKHLKSTAWNLNRIANVLESMNQENGKDWVVKQLRKKV